MKLFRKILFWAHLCLGLAAGVLIALMCLTGAILAFQTEILNWAEADAIQVEDHGTRERLSVDELVAGAKAAAPELPFSQVEIPSAEDEAWIIQAGRGEFRYLDPYTGAFREGTAVGLRKFFHLNLMLHRWLALEGDARGLGKNINGISNAVFLFLALSGLYLWFPRQWRWKQFKLVLFFKSFSQAKARNFNWHNVFGFWALLPIVLMAFTAAMFHYDWARNTADALFGQSPPRPGQALQAEARSETVSGPDLSLEERFQIAAAWPQAWDSIQMSISTAEGQPSGKRRGPPAPDPAVVLVQESGLWFPFNRPSELIIHPQSGEIEAERTPRELSLKQKIRSSFRWIHTGEAGLLPGKIIAFLGCVAGIVLVYTGFALSIHRLKSSLRKKKQRQV
ncbi:PepSY-associated TM helix domain-containing protein [Coraliomargarita parva]|uniref:PepSY-associated TM helix domain-containing protein n=1 Tax=Coraliomargarita parva TaxID=3014050 RepID=UPI0022B413E5|nr:PepSY-associated TM helix domain-containing protein [Coraliomargarita parva]